MDRIFTRYSFTEYLKQIVFLIILLIGFTSTTLAQDFWSKKSDFGGSGRSGAIGFSVNGKGYIGLGSGNPNDKELWEYDPQTNIWLKKAEFPGNPKISAAVFTINNKAYVCGGQDLSKPGYALTSDVYEYDPIKNSWTRKADLPVPLANAVAFGIDGKGYIGTGLTPSEYTKAFYQYDPVNNSWKRKADFGGEGRADAAGFAVGTKGYIGTGGSTSGGGYHVTGLNDFWEYDSKDDRWSRKADFPDYYGNYNAVAFSINDKGYWGTGSDHFGYVTSTYVYDTSTNLWLSIAPYGISRDNPQSEYVLRNDGVGFALNGKGYIGTGHFGADFTDFYEYTPCGTKNFSAEFTVVQDNYKVNLAAKSNKGVKYLWTFEDGNTDTTSTVYHDYNDVGIHKVTLICSNICYADTVTKNVVINGFKGIANNHGGNVGNFTASILGAGFTKIYLSKGGQQIQGENLSLQNSGMAATFNLDKQTLGQWDIFAVFPDGKTITLPNAFTIEDAVSPKLDVQLAGQTILRIGFNQIYTVTCRNSGNTDAKFVPILVSGLPVGTKIELVEPTFKFNEISAYSATKYLLPRIEHTIIDSTTKTSFRLFYIQNIAANSSKVFHVVFHLPQDNSLLHTYPTIRTIVGKSINSEIGQLKTPVKTNGFNRTMDSVKPTSLNEKDYSAAADCLTALLNAAETVALQVSGVDEWLSCGAGVAGLVNAGIESYVNYEPGQPVAMLDGADYATGVMSTYLDCGKAAIGTAFAELKVVKIVSGLLLSSESLLQGMKIVDQCTKAFDPQDDSRFSPIIGNAVDPNELNGPGDASAPHYTNQNSVLNYTIGFENKPSANLNAQTVTVVDTLKSNYFNLSTFGFTSVIIGDSILNFSAPVKSFIHDFDFTSSYGVKARVVADFDTLKGIAQWKFFTIDPLTNQITGDALAGFLPPNISSPKGQGYVSYHVSPKAGLSTGDKTQNQAFITFDYNPVIATNEWNNTFDFVAPKSKVSSLKAVTKDTSFAVTWSGTDNLSGIQRYNIYYATGSGPYQTWLNGTAATSGIFKGQVDSVYHFYSIAIDNAGNEEGGKSMAEAVTTVRIPRIQIIQFPAITAKKFGDADFDAGAAANSALPIFYKSSDQSVISIANGKLHIAGAGSVTITASQAGNDSWLSAKDVSILVTVIKAKQSINFAAIPAKTYHDADFATAATSSSSLPVSYAISNATVLSISNNIVHILTPGRCTIKAWQPGNNNYFSSDTVSREIQVLFTLPANNFAINSTSLSCRNSNNGEINISSLSAQNFTATLSSGGASVGYSFTKDLAVKNLAAGSYDVCIMIKEYPDYKQCYNIEVGQPQDLSVYSNVNSAAGEIELHLEGGNTYNIRLNNVNYTTSAKQITLHLENGKNMLTVSSDLKCQGVYEQTINLPLGISTYPNPFNHILSISVSNDKSATAGIDVYTLYGKTVYSDRKDIRGGKCSVDLSALRAGVYILKVTTDHSDKRVKIIKQ